MEERKMKFVSLWICLICIIVFILQRIIPAFTDNFMLTSQAFPYKIWQFFTAIFLHGSLAHLAYNMFALLLFGLMLEKLIGFKKFIILFIFSGVIANIFASFLYPDSLGASGAIMALIGCLAILKPMMIVWAFGMIMPMFVLAIIWIAGSVLGIFGFGDQSTGYLAHLSGIFIGIIYGFYLRLRFKTRRQNKNQISAYNKTQKIIIPEDYVRTWEDYYIK